MHGGHLSPAPKPKKVIIETLAHGHVLNLIDIIVIQYIVDRGESTHYYKLIIPM